MGDDAKTKFKKKRNNALNHASSFQIYHRCSERSKRSVNFFNRTRSFKFFLILFLANVSEREFFNLSCAICMKIYENIQHSMDIYDEIFIL